MGELAAEETIRVVDALAAEAATLEEQLRAGAHDRMSVRGCVLADVERLQALIARIRSGLKPDAAGDVPPGRPATDGVASFTGVAANDNLGECDECLEPLVLPVAGLFADLEAGTGAFYRSGAVASLPLARQARIVLGWLDGLWDELRVIGDELAVEWGKQMPAADARACVQRVIAAHAGRVVDRAEKP